MTRQSLGLCASGLAADMPKIIPKAGYYFLPLQCPVSHNNFRPKSVN